MSEVEFMEVGDIAMVFAGAAAGWDERDFSFLGLDAPGFTREARRLLQAISQSGKEAGELE